MVIYKTVNLINGKFYIGKDSNNYPNYLGGGKLIKLAIKKYGKNNFKKETIEECDSLDELNKREIFWIDKLNAKDSRMGYNILDGGEISPMYENTHTEETKLKMSDNHYDCSGLNNPMYGKTFKDAWVEQGLSNKEIKKKWNKWLKTRSELSTGKNNGMYGKSRFGIENPFFNKKHKESTKKKLRENSKTKKNVLQYSLDGDLIKQWESTMDVYRELNINCRNCCRGETKTAGGFKWKYKDENKI